MYKLLYTSLICEVDYPKLLLICKSDWKIILPESPGVPEY